MQQDPLNQKSDTARLRQPTHLPTRAQLSLDSRVCPAPSWIRIWLRRSASNLPERQLAHLFLLLLGPSTIEEAMNSSVNEKGKALLVHGDSNDGGMWQNASSRGIISRSFEKKLVILMPAQFSR